MYTVGNQELQGVEEEAVSCPAGDTCRRLSVKGRVARPQGRLTGETGGTGTSRQAVCSAFSSLSW